MMNHEKESQSSPPQNWVCPTNTHHFSHSPRTAHPSTFLCLSLSLSCNKRDEKIESPTLLSLSLSLSESLSSLGIDFTLRYWVWGRRPISQFLSSGEPPLKIKWFSIVSVYSALT